MDQLKDVILSTLAEIQESVPEPNQSEKKGEEKATHSKESKRNSGDSKTSKDRYRSKENFFNEVTSKQKGESVGSSPSIENELLFLNSLRERMLVLFEGFQAPNNTSIEAKVDLTLNFLEYVLSTVDERIEKIKGR